MTHEFKAFTDARAQIPGSALAGLGAALRNTAAVRRAVPAILFTILLFGADAMRVAHADGLTLSPELSRTYKNQLAHDPSNIDRAREIASSEDPIPVGILYRNPHVPCYEDVRHAGQMRTPEHIRVGLEAELDRFTIWPKDAEPAQRAA